jgi:hypothetical protein
LPADPKHVEKCKRAIAILEESYIAGNDVALYDKRTGLMVTISNDAIPLFRQMISEAEKRAEERR